MHRGSDVCIVVWVGPVEDLGLISGASSVTEVRAGAMYMPDFRTGTNFAASMMAVLSFNEALTVMGPVREGGGTQHQSLRRKNLWDLLC